MPSLVRTGPAIAGWHSARRGKARRLGSRGKPHGPRVRTDRMSRSSSAPPREFTLRPVPRARPRQQPEPVDEHDGSEPGSIGFLEVRCFVIGDVCGRTDAVARSLAYPFEGVDWRHGISPPELTSVSGRATCSSGLPSASMPRKISTSPPMIMTPPPIRYPMVSPARWEPLPISAPNRIGPLAPKTWAMAKNTAMASARISTGKISLTGRYPLLALAEAKQKTTIQINLWAAACSTTAANSQALKASMAPEIRYVPEIIFRRPHVSNSWPSSSGPARLPTANTRPYKGTMLLLTW